MTFLLPFNADIYFCQQLIVAGNMREILSILTFLIPHRFGSTDQCLMIRFSSISSCGCCLSIKHFVRYIINLQI